MGKERIRDRSQALKDTEHKCSYILDCKGRSDSWDRNQARQGRDSTGCSDPHSKVLSDRCSSQDWVADSMGLLD